MDATIEINPNGTREQILRIARGLIETRSYLGFSFQDVADAVGIRKASLYHHFPSKEALGVAVIERATQGFRVWETAQVTGPQDALESYFCIYRDTLRAGAGLCPAGAMTPGWDCVGDESHRAIQALRQTQVLWLTGVLGALLPSAQGDSSVAALAAFVFSTCQGAMISARMTGRVEDFDEAMVQLRRSLTG